MKASLLTLFLRRGDVVEDHERVKEQIMEYLQGMPGTSTSILIPPVIPAAKDWVLIPFRLNG